MDDFLEFNGLLSNLSKYDLQDLFRYLKSYQLTKKATLNLPPNISFGIETEFEDVFLSEVKKEVLSNPKFVDWVVKREITVEKNAINDYIGGEVASAILHDTTDDWHKVFELYKMLQHLGANSTDRCALHFHIGVQIFSNDIKYFKRFLKLWCVFEHIIFRFGYHESNIPREKIELYAPSIIKNIKAKLKEQPNFIERAKTINILDINIARQALAYDKYRDISSEEIRDNTIEVRSPNGTLDPIIVQNNANFFLKLALYVTSDYYDEDLINNLFKRVRSKKISIYSNIDFEKALLLSDLIFNNGQDKIDFLRGYIKNGDSIRECKFFHL